MTFELLMIGLAGVLASASPIVVATIGETLSERAGVINLSLNGTLILSAMAGFAVASTTDSLLLGFLLGGLIGAVVALIIVFSSITLKLSQVAVGFVLTFMCQDIAFFLGSPYIGISGPRVPPAFPIPILSQIPIIGAVFFRQNTLTYLSFVLVALTIFWFNKTRSGLILQAIGEKPAAAYVRGINVNKLRYIYTVIGGFLVGLSGPMYSLSVRAGWQGKISGLDGIGWIVLAIVIFGGWKPGRAILGAYFFGLLQWLSLSLQPSLPAIPPQVLQVAPFPLMIITLLLVNIGRTEWVERSLAGLPDNVRLFIKKILRALRATPPESLGVPFEPE